MAEPAIRHMTLAEFLQWEDGTDTRWELIDGVPVAMAPPAVAHGRLAIRLGGRIDAALASRRPCFVQSEAGVVRPDRDSTRMVAEIMRREGERWITEIVSGQNGILSLTSIELSVPMSELYEDLELPEPPSRQRVPGL